MVNHEEQPYEGDKTFSAVVPGTIGSILCAFLAVGIIAAYLPRQSPLGWSFAFLAASLVLLAMAVVSLARRSPFAWNRFFTVAKWVLILTGIFSGMAEFMFIYDGTPGTTLAILTVVLILTAVDIPVLLGFSVARHERLPE